MAAVRVPMGRWLMAAITYPRGSVMATTTDPFYRIEVFVCRLVVIADQWQWCTCALSRQF